MDRMSKMGRATFFSTGLLWILGLLKTCWV